VRRREHGRQRAAQAARGRTSWCRPRRHEGNVAAAGEPAGGAVAHEHRCGTGDLVAGSDGCPELRPSVVASQRTAAVGCAGGAAARAVGAWPTSRLRRQGEMYQGKGIHDLSVAWQRGTRVPTRAPPPFAPAAMACCSTRVED
jgi:hypothetical protein